MVKKWSLFASLFAGSCIVPASAQAQVGIFNPRTNFFYQSSPGGNPGFGGWQGGGVYRAGGGWISPAGYSGFVPNYSYGSFGYGNMAQGNSGGGYVIPGWGASSTSSGLAAPRTRDTLGPAVGVPYNSALLTNYLGNNAIAPVAGSSNISGASFVPPAPAVVEGSQPLNPGAVISQPGCCPQIR